LHWIFHFGSFVPKLQPFWKWLTFSNSHDMFWEICQYILNGPANLDKVGFILLQIKFHRYPCVVDTIVMLHYLSKCTVLGRKNAFWHYFWWVLL
jgi:hypothetical protein